jgi:hypothetical protein
MNKRRRSSASGAILSRGDGNCGLSALTEDAIFPTPQDEEPFLHLLLDVCSAAGTSGALGATGGMTGTSDFAKADGYSSVAHLLLLHLRLDPLKRFRTKVQLPSESPTVVQAAAGAAALQAPESATVDEHGSSSAVWTCAAVGALQGLARKSSMSVRRGSNASEIALAAAAAMALSNNTEAPVAMALAGDITVPAAALQAPRLSLVPYFGCLNVVRRHALTGYHLCVCLADIARASHFPVETREAATQAMTWYGAADDSCSYRGSDSGAGIVDGSVTDDFSLSKQPKFSHCGGHSGSRLGTLAGAGGQGHSLYSDHRRRSQRRVDRAAN